LSESLGGARFRFAHRAVILVVALEDINVCKRAECLVNRYGPVHLTERQVQKIVVPDTVGEAHPYSVALGAEGRVWTWGWGHYGQLGHNDMEHRLVPTLLVGEAFGGAAAVLVAAGRLQTVA